MCYNLNKLDYKKTEEGLKMKVFRVFLLVAIVSAVLFVSGCAVTFRPGVVGYETEMEYVPVSINYDYVVWDGAWFLYYRGPAVVHRDYQPRYRHYYRSGWRYYNHNHPQYRDNSRHNSYRIQPTRLPATRNRATRSRR